MTSRFPTARSWLLFVLLATTATAGCSTSHPPAPVVEPLPIRFQAELDRLRQKHALPGVTAAYLLPGGVIQAFASGSADREQSLPATAETRMLSGSTGKTFVAALALALQQEGKLDLDDPIDRWLGAEPWFDRVPNVRAITVRMLLNHSSGLIDHVYSEAFGRALLHLTPDQQFAPEELVAFILDSKPLFAAGQGYSYSDTNYILAGLILEHAGGAPYDQQIQRRFLYPLGLALTAPSRGRIHPGLAQGYLSADSPLAGLGETTLDHGLFRFDPGSEWTGGGLVTSPRDLVRWASALYGGETIGTKAVDEMWASVAPGSGEEGRSGYGLGVYIWKGEYGFEYGHGGWFPGYRTSFAFYRERGVAVATQTNTDVLSNEDIHQIRQALARVVLSAPESGAAAAARHRH
jgi:D-alanyl-D-alanine carboxypeptidase